MKYYFIGAGPANIFSILYLLEKKKVKGEKIVLVDKGKNIYDRDFKEILFGFLGAGGFSDGKFIFSKYEDEITTWVSLKEKEEIFNFIKKVIKDFCEGDYKKFFISKEQEIRENFGIEKTIEIRESEIIHLGTNNNLKFGKKIFNFLEKNKVSMIFEEELKQIDLKKQMLFFNSLFIRFSNNDFIQLGLGKTGYNFIKTMKDNFNWPFQKASLNFGCRLETIYNERIENLVENFNLYDFKFLKIYKKENIEFSLRTFCVNHKEAYVVKEKVKDYFLKERVQYNGHAFRGKKFNYLTNFAILFNIDSDFLDIKRDFLDIFQEGVKDNQIIYLTKGKKDLKFTSSLQLPKDKVREKYLKDIFLIPFLKEAFEDFLSKINEILNLEKEYILFWPEIKVSPGILDLEKDFSIKNRKEWQNFHWVGDCCTGSRGIVPAIISGIMSIKNQN